MYRDNKQSMQVQYREYYVNQQLHALNTSANHLQFIKCIFCTLNRSFWLVYRAISSPGHPKTMRLSFEHRAKRRWRKLLSSNFSVYKRAEIKHNHKGRSPAPREKEMRRELVRITKKATKHNQRRCIVSTRSTTVPSSRPTTPSMRTCFRIKSEEQMY